MNNLLTHHPVLRQTHHHLLKELILSESKLFVVKINLQDSCLETYLLAHRPFAGSLFLEFQVN